uniref:Uncharacterized protein n=1 Tax=Arundo donax TaxID=35708 RepID=A0A0A9B8L2_ARUDO
MPGVGWIKKLKAQTPAWRKLSWLRPQQPVTPSPMLK